MDSRAGPGAGAAGRWEAEGLAAWPGVQRAGLGHRMGFTSP